MRFGAVITYGACDYQIFQQKNGYADITIGGFWLYDGKPAEPAFWPEFAGVSASVGVRVLEESTGRVVIGWTNTAHSENKDWEMIIDFHTHIFPDALAPKAMEVLVGNANGIYTPCTDGTAEGLMRYMDKCGVDISVVQPVATKPTQSVRTNEWAVSTANEKLIFFGAFHPHTDDYKRDIDRICWLGLKGIKLHAEYQDFTVDAPEMLKIYDYAFSKGLVILQHGGFDPAYKPPFRSSPKRFANAAKQMQGGVMIAAHFGGHDQWDDVEKYIVGTNIYIDTSMGFSYFPHDQFLRIVRAHGADKVLFATDSPWSRADEEIAALESMALTRQEKDNIFYKNAKRILNI